MCSLVGKTAVAIFLHSVRHCPSVSIVRSNVMFESADPVSRDKRDVFEYR